MAGTQSLIDCIVFPLSPVKLRLGVDINADQPGVDMGLESEGKNYLKILLSKGNFTFSTILILLKSLCFGFIRILCSPCTTAEGTCSRQA